MVTLWAGAGGITTLSTQNDVKCNDVINHHKSI